MILRNMRILEQKSPVPFIHVKRGGARRIKPIEVDEK